MTIEIPLEKTTERAAELMRGGGHWGPTVLQVMWEAYGLDNEDFLWAGTSLYGGLGGYRKGVCGALASSAVCLGFRHRVPTDDKEAAEKAREKAGEKTKTLAESFDNKFGDIACEEIVDFGDNKPGTPEFRAIVDEKCIPIVRYAIEKLYELDG